MKLIENNSVIRGSEPLDANQDADMRSGDPDIATLQAAIERIDYLEGFQREAWETFTKCYLLDKESLIKKYGKPE